MRRLWGNRVDRFVKQMMVPLIRICSRRNCAVPRRSDFNIKALAESWSVHRVKHKIAGRPWEYSLKRLSKAISINIQGELRPPPSPTVQRLNSPTLPE